MPGQIEFSLSVPVCAWCRPRRTEEGPGAISHGICPRHFRQVLLEAPAAISSAALNAAVSLVRDSRRLVQSELAPLVGVAA